MAASQLVAGREPQYCDNKGTSNGHCSAAIAITYLYTTDFLLVSTTAFFVTCSTVLLLLQ